VVDHRGETIHAVDGVLGCDWSVRTKGVGTVNDFETALRAALLTAIPVVPKELARVMAQYARPSPGVRTIAGAHHHSGFVDGHALREAKFSGTTGIAVDTSDLLAGPQLIVGDHTYGLIRCLNLRTEMVTTIAGMHSAASAVNGPALQVGFNAPYGIAVAPNGVIFVALMDIGAVLRISAPKRSAKGVAAERFVTTVVGRPAENPIFAASAALRSPLALCLTSSSAASSTAGGGAGGGAGADEKDAVRLFVGCADGVHSFDLARGERKHFSISNSKDVTGLVLDVCLR
jgi:hypothetical protein